MMKVTEKDVYGGWKLLDKPIRKTRSELKTGDVIETYYGDFDNVVVIMFSHNIIKDLGYAKEIETVGRVVPFMGLFQEYGAGKVFHGFHPEYKGRETKYTVLGCKK